MRRGLSKGQSPAMIVAIVALVAAVGGTAVAGVATISKLSKQEKKQVRTIAKAESDRGITRRAPGLSVSSAKTAGIAGSAKTADHAISADQATDAGTANGVKPVKVAFSAPAASSKTILAVGGITISANCDGLGRTEARFEPTPGGGVLDVVRTSGTESTTSTQSFNQANFASGFGIGTAGSGVVFLLTITYVGTSGTTITGNLTIAQGTSIAQCVVDGTLFVG